MPASEVTVVIPARHAGRTIGRAIDSALADGARRILVVDHASTDDTEAAARRAGGSRLSWQRAPADATLGGVRQAGLDAVDTPVAVWLDADDEILPGRLRALCDALDAGADLAVDEAEIVVGTHGRFARLPAFLLRPPGLFRLFERNYLPVCGPLACRVSSARHVGYDGSLNRAEDYDFVLRSLARGLRVVPVPHVGYRIHASPSSMSRDMAGQLACVRRALAKHADDEIAARLREAGASPHVVAWALCYVDTIRGEWDRAREWTEQAAALGIDAATIVEPDGPCPRPEGWRLDFHRGTLDVLQARPGAADLERAVSRVASPDALNNLGVAVHRDGAGDRARALFERALRLYPGYADARENLAASRPSRVTTLPLRAHVARDDY